MATFTGKGDVHTSPSTISISSLLASCSLGSSSTYSRSLRSSIQYKDKLYDSASKALEAYIQDFEESLESPVASTGQICIRTDSAISNTMSSKQKAASREWMGKPSSFSSTSRRRFTSDPELVSLTTDDLLGFASDGSLPVDQTYMSKLNSRKQINGKGRPPSKKLMKSSQRSSSLDHNAKVNFYNMSISEEKLKCKDAKKKHMLEMENATLDHKLHSDPFTLSSEDWKLERVPTSSSKDYPRWLTSQKSDLNVSGITSISDIKYPVWLKNYDLLSDSGSHNFSQTDKTTEKGLYAEHKQSFDERFLGLYEPFNSIPQNGNMYSESEDKELLGVDQHARTCDPQRLPFKGSSLPRHSKEPFKDDQIELLLLKAERTLESSNRGFLAPTHKHCSPQSEDILEADRSWEKIPVTFKSPVPVFCEEDEDIQGAKQFNPVNELHRDGLKNERQEQESTLSGGNHHGPVEALKQMLFNLQTVQQNFARDQSAEENVEIKKISTETTSEFKLFDQEMMPVNNSLQKALHHLSRLKELVEESNVKQAQECLNLDEEN